MEIYIVQRGDTLQSIAEVYGVSVERIIRDNGFEATSELVPGQTVIITSPEKTYVVQNGDTLQEIADKNSVTVLDLLRNNPYLSDRQYIFPGETLVINFGKKIRRITTNGYASEYINRATLTKTLPYLTYLSVIGYTVTGDGEVSEINDFDILRTAKNYGVAPLLVITTLSTFGQINVENAYTILNNENNMDRLISNLVNVLKTKGYYGINVTYELLSNLTLSAYETFNTKAYSRFKAEGFAYFITIAPNIIFTADRITFEKIDYSRITNQSDGTIILNYIWGSYLGPPAPIASVSRIEDFLDFLIPQILPGKLTIGMPLIAYDWELPYVIGISRAVSLTLDAAIILAQQVGAEIQFDEPSQTPYYVYNESRTGIAIEHVVWFVDARSINAILKIITERGLGGSGLWNIMRFVPQLWLVISTQYEIENVPKTNLLNIQCQ